jgi:hypothetical protein
MTHDTNVDQKIAALLTSYGPVAVTRMVSVPKQQIVCEEIQPDHLVNCHPVTVYVSEAQTTNEVLTASNIHISSNSAPNWGPGTTTEFPLEIQVESFFAQVCADASTSATVTETLQHQFSRSSSMQISQSVMTSQSAQLSFDTEDILPFKVGAQVTVGQQETTGVTKIDTTQDTVMRQVQLSTSPPIPPGKAEILQLQVWPVKTTLPFTMTVTVDGDLSSNNNGFKHLSDMFSAAQRTFSIAGTLEATDASMGAGILYSAPYDESKCSGGSQLVLIPQFKIPSDWKLGQKQEHTKVSSSSRQAS